MEIFQVKKMNMITREEGYKIQTLLTVHSFIYIHAKI